MTEEIRQQSRKPWGCMLAVSIVITVLTAFLANHYAKTLSRERQVFQIEERAKQATGPCGSDVVLVIRVPGQDVRFAIAGRIVTPEEFAEYVNHTRKQSKEVHRAECTYTE